MTLGYMHGLKVIHGDLHPGNVLFEKVDGYLEPFVADFGGSVDYSDPDQVGVTGSTLSRESVGLSNSLGCHQYRFRQPVGSVSPNLVGPWLTPGQNQALTRIWSRFRRPTFDPSASCTAR